jgi:hypothetical protein
MRRPWIIFFLNAGGALLSGAVLDRIAVTAGRQVITESDVILELRVDALLDQKPVDLSGDQKRKAADRLVDQLLILQEATLSRVPLATEEDGAQMLQHVRAEYQGEGGYRAALARDHVTDADVTAHLLAGLRALRFTDLRFRPEVQVSEDELRDYYKTLVERWKLTSPDAIPTFEASREQVEKLLTDDRTTQALDRWLGTQRTQTEILYHEAVFK